MSIGPQSFRLNGSLCRFVEFSPIELEKIVGFTPSEYEDWEASGALPWRYSDPQPVTGPIAVETLIKHRLSRFGVSPNSFCDACGHSISVVYYFMLATMDNACEVSGLREDVQRYVEEFGRDDSIPRTLTGLEGIWVHRFLARKDQSLEFERRVKLGASNDDRSEFDGELIDLMDLAKEFYQISAKPLIYVDLKHMIVPDRLRVSSQTIAPIK